MIKIALETQDETRWIGVLLGSGTAVDSGINHNPDGQE